MTIHVYQDEDPLGKGEWFAYTSRNGHIVDTFGGYKTEEESRDAAYRSIPKR